MNKTETDKNNRKKPAKKRKPAPRKKTDRKKPGNNLMPLLIILIILLATTLYLTFGDSSSFLSSLVSRDTDTPPAIERPQIVQRELPPSEPEKDDNFAVTKEVPLTEESGNGEEIDQSETPSREIKSRLFFVKVSDEGQISLKSIIRTVPYETAPLTETMRSLLTGPDRSDMNKGLLNLIPQNSQLISVKISGGTAFLDFSENFRYNSLGFEGYKAQLMQIVYTATEFDSVDNVQILIGGEKLDYLGAEGVYIGEPLDRDYFNTF